MESLSEFWLLRCKMLLLANYMELGLSHHWLVDRERRLRCLSCIASKASLYKSFRIMSFVNHKLLLILLLKQMVILLR